MNLIEEHLKHISRIDSSISTDAECIDFLKSYVKDVPDKECYILCILSRKKNNPGMVDSAQIMRRRLIFKSSDVENAYAELIKERAVLHEHNFYMYVSVNARSIKKCLEEMTHACVRMLSKFDKDEDTIKHVVKMASNWYSILQIPETRGSLPRRFLIDIDTDDARIIQSTTDKILSLKGEILVKRKTRGGYHLVTTPFDLSRFNPPENVECERDGMLFIKDMGCGTCQHENI